jgi:two-component system, NtrC family, response regulator HydG
VTNAATSILVVDDEVDTCRNLADIFADLGFRVATAHDGNAALEELRNSRYDIALLDLMMPGMDGVTLYQEMKRQRPEMVAVLTTAYPNHPRAEESLKAGVWRIVPKPVDLARLLNLLNEAAHLPLVLVIDDDTDLCATLWDLLWEHGFRVSFAHDIRNAAELLRDDRFNVILIDMRLPDGDGFEALRLVRQAESQARIVFITGHRTELGSSLEHVKEEGVDAFCYKPFDVRELLATIERLTRL